MVEDSALEYMTQYLLSKQNNYDESTIRNDILRKMHYIIDTYDSLDKKFINVIDDKNRRYTRATTQKIDYLLNSDQSIKGNIITILKGISDTENEERILNMVNNSFELYEQSFISDESIYVKKKAVKRNRNSDLIMSDEFTDFEEKAKAVAMQMFNSQYSKSKVNEYVENLFGNELEVTSNDINIENDYDYIMMMLSVIQANDRGSKYTVEIKNENVLSGDYKIPFIVYRKRGAK